MSETEEWRVILTRLLDVTLHCASRGLPFQGDNCVIGDPRNGNFLVTLELLGKYDRVTYEHLAKVKKLQTEGKSMPGFLITCHGRARMNLLKYVLRKF